MRNATITLISLCLLCTTASLPAAADIFNATSPGDAPASGEAVSLPPMNPSRVLRQRAVRIDWDAVAATLDGRLRLNLFEDVTLEVAFESVSDGPDGSRICYGKVVAGPPGRVTMVVGETRMAATLTTADRTYKIRPIDDNWHLVRDIRPHEGGPSPWAAVATSDERMVWTLTNQERAENGLHGLSLDGELTEAARAHSADMAAQNYFSHDSLDGRSPGDRVTAEGYERYTGENIAAGYNSPEAVVVGWMNSSGHRANILSSNHCDLGVGFGYDENSEYRTYWTQDFGRQAGVSECPPVSDDDGENGGDSGGDDGDDSGSDDGEDPSDDGGSEEPGGDNGTDGNSKGSGSSGGGCFINSAVQPR